MLYAYISNTWNIESKCSSIPLTKGKDVLRALLALQTEFHMMTIVSSDSSRLMPIHRIYDQMPWADSWAIGLLSESKLVEAALHRQFSLACKHSPSATVKSLVNMTFSPEKINQNQCTNRARGMNQTLIHTYTTFDFCVEWI